MPGQDQRQSGHTEGLGDLQEVRTLPSLGADSGRERGAAVVPGEGPGSTG